MRHLLRAAVFWRRGARGPAEGSSRSRLLATSAACLPGSMQLELDKALESGTLPADSAQLVRRLWQHCAPDDVAAAAEAAQPSPFVLMLPPPNVTGALHMGHALAFVIQDALVRWHRIRGRRTLWLPGFDHAGIATQVLMERKLQQELGLSRHQIGRERFVAEAAKWADEKRSEIRHQMELLGLALDWRHEFFTYDQRHSQVVTDAFVRLFDDGLIYRSEQLVHWSCALQSAISDIEVETLEIQGPTRLRVPGHPRPVEFGRLHQFVYPLADGDGEGVAVATTRPETMFGDTAVAVHPADARYARLIGRRLRHPLAADGRQLPVVASDSVDPAFGTGAVKLTPLHSRADFAVDPDGAATAAPVFTEAGAIAAGCGAPAELVGAPRFAARDDVIGRLADLGLYRGATDHAMSLPICSRSGDIVEQMLKSQWFVRCSGQMADRAAEAVRDGRLRIQPAGYAAEWMEWMRRVGDWCVSRQIWWGHRVPAYEVIGRDGRSLGWVAARTDAEAAERASRQFGAADCALRRDPDVLDTWFSSGLLPLSLADWPGRGVPDPARMPLSLLETGHDILFFWAARMVMLTEQLSGQLPFHSVLLNGLVCDSGGRKMSKSRGNVVDPVGLLGRGGPDALRLALCSHRFQLDRVAFDQQLVDACSRLLNKLWQSHRFLRPRLLEAGLLGRGDVGALMEEVEAAEDQLDKVDTWLLSRLASLSDDCEASFSPDSLQLQEAANRLRQFWVADFCDVGLECLKSPAASPASALVACLASAVFLRQLHPFCPHVCELLWHGAHGGAPLAAASAASTADRLRRWRSVGQEEVAGLVRDLLARFLDWRSLLRPTEAGACVLLYNSAKCPIDATLYSRMIAQLGRTRIVPAQGGGLGPGPLLRLELCAGLHFAAPKSILRIDEAAKELVARRQKQQTRREQLLLLLQQQSGVAAAAEDASSASQVGSGGTDAQMKKLASLTEQLDRLTDRLQQLESRHNWDW